MVDFPVLFVLILMVVLSYYIRKVHDLENQFTNFKLHVWKIHDALHIRLRDVEGGRSNIIELKPKKKGAE